MSEVRSRFDIERRLSFFKTPMTRNPLQVIGQKRNYAQLSSLAEGNENSEQHPDKFNACNPNKKRRLLTTPEIENLAKSGGFNPSHILIAIEEPDGFQWWKLAKPASTNSPETKQKYMQKYGDVHNSKNEANDGVLRELSKDEIKQRKQSQKEKDKQQDEENSQQNPNDANKQNAQKALQKAAKTRRHTVSVEVLNKLREQNDEKQRELMSKKRAVHHEPAGPHKEKKSKKRRVKVKKKKVVRYVAQQQVVRKKVRKKKRVVYKKKTRSMTIKITTEFASVDIPDFPIPNLRLSAIYFSVLEKPFIAIQNFELSLIESFIIPLTEVYGQDSYFSFITQNVLQFLMQLKQHLSDIVNCVEFAVLNVPLQSSIQYQQQQQQQTQQTEKTQALSSCASSNENARQQLAQNDGHSVDEHGRRMKTPNIEEDNDLDDELKFYQQQFVVLDEFCSSVQTEIDFTQNVHAQLQDEEYLRKIFDFDLNANDTETNQQNAALQKQEGGHVWNDNEFINAIADDMDVIYSAYEVDFAQIKLQQDLFEQQLNERRLKQLQLTDYYMNSVESERQEDRNKDDCKKQNASNPHLQLGTNESLAASNFIHANKNNDHLEDDTLFDEGYLRRFDGYQLTENDTLDLGNLQDIDWTF
mmetsp:Transcript_38212/g.61174  ORF Transcript_38212/g.61174 Transcript_38212/m.61174 type:complete len:641 (-) Transcript_38212:163-2085(-)